MFAPLENGMFGNLQHHVQIAHRPAVHARLPFLRETKLGAVIDARGNVDLQFALAPEIAVALALLAGPAHDLPAAAALRAGPAHAEEGLLINHFPTPAAGGAGDQPVLRLRAFSTTAHAFLQARNLNVHRKPAHGILESDFEIVANIFAALRPIAPLPAAPAENIGEPKHVA